MRINPKDRIGAATKAPVLSTLPLPVLAEVSVVALLGARKYGRHNWREGGVSASVYVDAVGRHLIDWWEGEDLDADRDEKGNLLGSGVSNLSSAICGLMILRDAQMRGGMVDDRPPPTPGSVKAANAAARDVLDAHPNGKPPVTAQGFPEGLEAALDAADAQSRRDFAAEEESAVARGLEELSADMEEFRAKLRVFGPEENSALAEFTAEVRRLAGETRRLLRHRR